MRGQVERQIKRTMRQMKSRTIIITVIATILSAGIGVGLLLLGLIGSVIFHDGPALFGFVTGVLPLLFLVNFPDAVGGLLFVILLPVYWGMLAWIASRVKTVTHVTIFYFLLFLMQVVIPYWTIFYRDLGQRSDFLSQWANHRIFVGLQMIIVVMANTYIFALPIVFWWLSSRKIRRSDRTIDFEHLGKR